jgi:hypothetical protein
MADFIEEPVSLQLASHLKICDACRTHQQQLADTLVRIQPAFQVRASLDFKERTMKKLANELAAAQAAKPYRQPHPVWRLAFSAGLVLAIILALPNLGNRGKNGAVSLLAQSVEALGGMHSVHITARMRTVPGDNFELIGTQYDFVPLEMWKEFGATPRWRVENPGRIVVMDGKGSLMLMNGNHAVRGGVHANFIEWLKPLLDPEQVLPAELKAAQQGESNASLKDRMTLVVDRKAQGRFVNGVGRNSSIAESDHTRVYRFDPATNRLAGLQVIVHDAGKDVVVFETTDIRYDEPVAPELFALTLPPDVIWAVPPEQMPVSGTLPTNPREAAQAFLEGMATRDWDRVLSVYPSTSIDPRLMEGGGGLQVISLGEPYRSGLYAGWFVPYTIKFPNGRVKKWNLAVRNDNSAHRWVFDGGF